MKDLNGIFCSELKAVEEYDFYWLRKMVSIKTVHALYRVNGPLSYMLIIGYKSVEHMYTDYEA